MRGGQGARVRAVLTRACARGAAGRAARRAGGDSGVERFAHHTCLRADVLARGVGRKRSGLSALCQTPGLYLVIETPGGQRSNQIEFVE